MANIKVYAAGGAGINIAKHFSKTSGVEDETGGFATLDICYIDTSKSNITNDVDPKAVYVLDNVDGSGKKRSTNYNALVECSKEIIHKFRPESVNIVIHSGSGGTGSVLGSILVSELLSRGELVVVVLVGGTSSRIETENTVKTLKSYESISSKRNTPVNVIYRENSIDKKRADVDKDAHTAILMMAAMFSGNNRELDSEDLRNFLNYHNVTSYSPKLSYLEFFSKEIDLRKGEFLTSVATLVDNDTSSELELPTEYQTVGYLPEQSTKAMSITLPIHACIIGGYFNGVVDRLEKKLAMYDEVRNVVVEKTITKPGDSSTDSGIIL